MRVCLTTWGSRGDVEPLAGLAAALLERGAEVEVCAPPDEEFVALLDGVGVALRPLGPSTRSIVTADPRPDAFQLAAKLVAARFEVLGEAAKGCDALLATGLMPAGAPDVAEKLGLRYVLATFHLGGMPSRHRGPLARPGTPSPVDETDVAKLWAQDAERVDGLYGEPTNRGRAALGLPPVTGVRDRVFTPSPWLAADPVLCPSDGESVLDLRPTGAWFRPDHRPLPSDLTRFLDAGEPPVYVGFGSMASMAPKDIVPVALAAGRALGRRVLFGRGWSDLVPADAPDCRAVDEVNQQALFPRVAAVVHHGGAGTTHTAARAGVPQVIVPLIADQPYWASRITALGIGATPAERTPTVESLTAALATALAPDTVRRARELAPTVRTDGAAAAAELLLSGR